LWANEHGSPDLGATPKYQTKDGLEGFAQKFREVQPPNSGGSGCYTFKLFIYNEVNYKNANSLILCFL